MSKFFMRLCFLIFAIQLVVIFAYNSWFNKLWEPTKQMVFHGFKISGELFGSWHASSGFKVLTNTIDGFWEMQEFAFTRSLWVWLLLPLFIMYMILFDEEQNSSREYIGGRQCISPWELSLKATRNWKHRPFKFLSLKNLIKLGKVYLPRPDEIKGTFLGGKPGSGKTNAFNQIITTVRKRKQRMIIHCYKGDYVEKFYDPKDGILFNPLDQRSVGWCLFNDCKSVMDIEAFAGYLIPDAAPGSDPFWNNAARDVMVGILRYCYINNKRTNKDIWETCIIPNDILYDMLKVTKGGERGAKHIEDTSSKTAASIMSNLMQYVKVFEYMVHMKGDFSITQWVKNKKGSGIIFVTNYERLKLTLNPMISLFIQTAGSVLLSEPDDLENRLFFFLDEFGRLQNLSAIESLMVASRSKGGSVFIGVQDIGQIDKVYKKETRATILNSAANRIIFNCKDHDTAKFFSTDIGKTEYYESMESQSLAMEDSDKLNTSRQRRREDLVTPEDIQALPDLTCFVSIGHHDIAYTKFKYKKYPKISESFIQRPELELSYIEDVVPFVPPAENDSVAEVKKTPAKPKAKKKAVAPEVAPTDLPDEMSDLSAYPEVIDDVWGHIEALDVAPAEIAVFSSDTLDSTQSESVKNSDGKGL